MGGIGNDAEIAAEVVRCAAQHFRLSLLEPVSLLQSLGQVVRLPGRFGTLHVFEPNRALAHRLRAEARNRAIRPVQRA